MARKHSTRTLLLVGGAAALAGSAGLLGPTAKALITTTWHDITGAFGGSHAVAGTTVTVAGSGGTTKAAHDCQDPATMTADARAKGITSATDPRAYAYGLNLWACQHGDSGAGYQSLSPGDQVTWNSVAINGH